MDIWLLAICAFAAGSTCIVLGLRRGGRLSVLVGLVLLTMSCFVVFLQIVAD